MRINYLPARAGMLARMTRGARSVYWLNPEAAAERVDFDSEMAIYAEH